METVEKAIIKTLSFFDLFSYPLTKEEIFSYLWQVKSEQDFVSKVLIELLDKKVVEEKNGYYFLLGREGNCEIRKNSLLESEAKLKIAHKAVKKINAVPFVKAIFVCNSVAFGLAKKDSDIDLLIVTTKKRLWLVRFFTNLILLLFGLRVGKNKAKSRICLSFYLNEDDLNLQNILVIPEDIYLVYWLVTLLPIFDNDKIKEKIIKSNSWINKFVPNFSNELSFYTKEIYNGWFKSLLKNILEKTWFGFYGDLMEKQAKEIQISKMKFALQNIENKAPGIVLNDSMLKFHENDKRKEYYEQWQATLKKFQFPIIG